MEISEIKNIRIQKLESLKLKGLRPYGGRFTGAVAIALVLKDFAEGKPVVVAGRIMAHHDTENPGDLMSGIL